MAIKAILFDAGGVLFFHVNRVFAGKLHKAFGFPEKTALHFLESKVDVMDIGKMQEKTLWNLFNQHFKSNVPLETAQKMHRESFKLRKDLFDFTKQLSKTINVGILSNMPKHLIKFIDENYDLSQFKYQFYSSNFKTIKPQRRFYLIAAKKMKLKPSEIVFVDDKMRNVIGARKAGLKSFRYKNLSDFKRNIRKLGIKY